MSQKFDWRAEDDNRWELDDGQDEPSKTTRFTRRKSIFAGAVVLLILSVGLLSLRQIGRYLNETGEEAEKELLLSNDLVLSAAREADPEVLASLLSDRDPAWAEGQLSLLASGLMFDRSPFGLEWQDERPAINEITVSPAIDSADVVSQLEYAWPSRQSDSETVTLKHVQHYRWNDNRWILSPPDGEYWGSAIVEEGYYLSIGFLERDAAFGRRLATDLEGVLAAFCYLDTINSCSSEFHEEVRLVADPLSIVEFFGPESTLARSKSLDLPTPSLFGYPDDEIAYEVMYRSYGKRLVSAIVAGQVGWRCCDQVLIYQALLDLQLSRLALMSWPLTGDHYRMALNQVMNFGERLWAEQTPVDGGLEGEDSILAHLLVEYIDSQRNALSVTDQQRNLFLSGNYGEWLATAIQSTDSRVFVDGWQFFLTSRLESLENQDA